MRLSAVLTSGRSLVIWGLGAMWTIIMMVLVMLPSLDDIGLATNLFAEDICTMAEEVGTGSESMSHD